MDSLDSIWDEPVVDDDPPVTPIKPKEALFLDGSDDEDDVAGPSSARGRAEKAPADIDMDALFAGVDDDDNDDAFTFKPLAPSLDTEALRREAELRHKNRLPTFTPHAILPSSSPPRDTGNGADETMKDRGDDKGKDTKKERRKPVRLDEGRLLGPTGFPQLIKDTKNFRTKGKGHEATDLNRLLQVYQFWTHGLYPKTQFRDTVERIEKLCHSKRMNVSLSVWRDEAHGRVNGNQDPEDNEVIDLTEHDASGGLSSGNRSAPDSDGAGYASSSSRPPSQPPSSGQEPDDDDGFNLEAIFRAEDQRRAKEKLEADGGMDLGNENEHGDRNRGKEKTTASLTDDDAMWGELDSLEGAPKPDQATSTNTGVDDDQAMWDELDQIQEAAKTTKANTASPKEPIIRQSMDDDEDMWDIVKELESTAPVASAVFVSDPPVPIQDDYDLEDIYM